MLISAVTVIDQVLLRFLTLTFSIRPTAIHSGYTYFQQCICISVFLLDAPGYHRLLHEHCKYDEISFKL